jgi:ATP-dependent Clp protease ATP-binding subunit ClpA
MSATKFKISDEQVEEMIYKYCRDLTALVRASDRFDPITGRDKEIRDTQIILLQKGRKNVALLAPAGVGKSALVVGLAQQVVAGTVPEYLKNARVIEIDLPAMAAGTSGPAEIQGRFIPLCKGVAERYHDPSYPKFVLFIDEMHTIMPSCEGSAYRGLSEVMKPYLTFGDLHVIGATTLDEFRIYVKLDPALDRRFQQVLLKVPNHPETVQILKNLKGGYEKHHHLTVSDNVIERVVTMTAEYMPRRNQPDKSIIVMDGAMALQVMTEGRGGDLKESYVREIVAIEAKLSAEALKVNTSAGGGSH